jgi:hypothetical protein
VEAIFHRDVMRRALEPRVSARALAAMTRANLNQDAPLGWFRPEFHWDNTMFAEALAYVETCQLEAARAARPAEAWAAFGRLSHAVQDFYSHSNYAALWLERHGWVKDGMTLYINLTTEAPAFPKGALPPPDAINGLDPAILKHPRLRSARVYYPTEFLWVVPGLQPLVKRLTPKDSHAWLNLDFPATGPLFPYSIEAAVQRTTFEFERTLALIGEEQGEAAMRAFCDQ